MKISAVVILALAIAFAVLRFLIPLHGLDLSVPTVFKDLAHVFVGFLFGAGFLGVLHFLVARHEAAEMSAVRSVELGVFLGILGALLTIVEVIAFFSR